MEQEDKELEKENIKKALSGCGYPRWSMDLVEKKLAEKEDQGRSKTKKLAEREQKNRGMVVLPYSKGLTEREERIMRNQTHKCSHETSPNIKQYFGPSQRQWGTQRGCVHY